MERMAEAGARVRLVILDACRDNPFERTKTLTRGGLAAMEGRGGLVAFAAEAGALALEPPGERNGLYTKHLLEALEEPGVSVRELFARVRTGRRATYGAEDVWDARGAQPWRWVHCLSQWRPSQSRGRQDAWTVARRRRPRSWRRRSG